MKYTIRFCHLETIPGHKVGDIITYSEKVARMGSTGKSTAPHLHMDCVEGYHSTPWRLSDMEHWRQSPSPRQLARFVCDGLFDTKIHVTSWYCDPYYFDRNGNLILHMAYDVVPEDRHETNNHFWIKWPINNQGIMLSLGNDIGYGNYLHVGFEA
jgi:hypothetical protein